jgi:hypothetical protein
MCKSTADESTLLIAFLEPIRELQRQRCKNLQRNEYYSAFLE